MNKTAFITGISGQDGAYLSKLLLEKGYKVIGGERRSASGTLWRLKELGIENDIEITDFELAEFTNIYRAIEKYEPEEIYNLAAQSFVASSFEIPTMTADVTGLGVSRLLEAIRKINPQIKFYQASSSEMFGKVVETPQDENTPFYPRSPYAVAKLFGHWTTINYRESYGMFACSGILFNHESPLRGHQFVTRKITIGLSKIKLGQLDYVELGNLDAKRDWGYAADYVEGMHRMLNHDKPDDYVLASGVSHSVRDFVNISCYELGLKIKWIGKGLDEKAINTETNKPVVKVNPKFYRPAEVDMLQGDSSKAQKILKWERKTSFHELVSSMIKFDYEKLKKK
jgi:GDPmannose 4,6-dehydratase